MNCPKCETRMKTYCTRAYKTATVRFRKCPKCGYKIKTVEE